MFDGCDKKSSPQLELKLIHLSMNEFGNYTNRVFCRQPLGGELKVWLHVPSETPQEGNFLISELLRVRGGAFDFCFSLKINFSVGIFRAGSLGKSLYEIIMLD